LEAVKRGGYRSPGPPPPPQPGMVPLEAATPSQALQGLWVLAVLARGDLGVGGLGGARAKERTPLPSPIGYHHTLDRPRSNPLYQRPTPNDRTPTIGGYRGGDLGAICARIDPADYQIPRYGLTPGSPVGATKALRMDVYFRTSTVEPCLSANGATVEPGFLGLGLTVKPPISAGRLTVEPPLSAGAGCALDLLGVGRHTYPSRSPHLPARLDDP